MTSPTRILGIDVGQSLGWALVGSGTVAAYGHLELPGKSPAELAGYVTRLVHLITMWDHPVDTLALEDVQFVSSRDAHASYWRIRTLVELAWGRHSSTVRTVPTGTLKRWATGKGNADKAAMCAAATRLTGHPFASKASGGTKAQEDQADAVLVALWAAEQVAGEP